MPAHKHADLIMQYAKKAQISETPWEFFEACAGGDWFPKLANRSFGADVEYRLKSTMITVTDARGKKWSWPEPLRVMPENGTVVFYPSFYKECTYEQITFHASNTSYLRLFKNDLLHDNGDAARAHAKAIADLSRGGE